MKDDDATKGVARESEHLFQSFKYISYDSITEYGGHCRHPDKQSPSE